MKFSNKFISGLIALLLVSTLAGCNFLKARDELNKGIRSVKDAKYETAIEHFKQSIEMDPSNDNAYLYLAFGYASLYVPGGDSPENKAVGEQAIKAYQTVLNRTPKSADSARGIAGIYFNMKEFEKSKEYHTKVAELQPKDPIAYYSIGNINWWLLFIHKDYPPEKKLELIKEGLQTLNKATSLDPNYADAYFYVNLLHRQEAQVFLEEFIAKNPKMKDKFPSPLDPSSPIVEPIAKKLLPAESYRQFKGYLDEAEKNWQKAMDLRKANEEKAAAKGAVEAGK